MMDTQPPDPKAAAVKAWTDEIQARRDARAKRIAEVKANGTAARLCTAQKKDLDTDPTDGAIYRKDYDLKSALDWQSNYACDKFNAGEGVVGPNYQENNYPFSTFNDLGNPSYEQNQLFASQHDLQATDADGQHPTDPDSTANYNSANKWSAVEGMWVLKTTGSVEKALKKTKQVFHDYGYEVREHY